MRMRDRAAIAWRGYWAEWRHEFRDGWERIREEFRDMQAIVREARHWDLIIRRKITGKQDPARKDMRRARREYRKEQREERRK